MRAINIKARRKEKGNDLKLLLGAVAGLALYEAISSLDETNQAILQILNAPDESSANESSDRERLLEQKLEPRK